MHSCSNCGFVVGSGSYQTPFVKVRLLEIMKTYWLTIAGFVFLTLAAFIVAKVYWFTETTQIATHRSEMLTITRQWLGAALGKSFAGVIFLLNIYLTGGGKRL